MKTGDGGGLDSWDVLVIGAGPAGSAAAISAAEAGLSVAMVERAPFPRHRPGETLPPGVEPILERLGVAKAVCAAGFPRHAGIRVRWGAEPARFEPFGADARGPWLGFQAWRADLDALLIREAVRRGVRLFQPCRAVRPLVSGGRVTGAQTDWGPLPASFVVDAAGGGHWLARHLGLPVVPASPRRIARFGYLRGTWPEVNDAPLLQGDRHGWLWAAHVRPNLYAWARLPLSPVPGRGATPPTGPGLKIVGRPVRGEDVTWRAATPRAGPGFLLAGDAAAVLDPASSHGVLRALMTGMAAADHVARVLREGRTCEGEAAAGYSDWLGRWFEHDCRHLAELYRRLREQP